ncbi:MAG: TolC family protein [Stigonema ocellatum SAG 48.90 = DSM 106950]|nr:TolC family protein [Stigonema ocellatum SAG 48.90 = DSM 106950]
MPDGRISNRNCLKENANSPSPTNTTDSNLKPTIPNPQDKRQIHPLTLKQVLEEASRNHHLLTAETRLQLTLQYYNMQRADEQVRIYQASVLNYQAALRDTLALERSGVGTRFDVLNTQVNLGNAQQKLTNAFSNQRTARLQLATQLDLPQSVDISAADPVQISGLWNHTLEESIVLAVRNKSEQNKQRNQIRLDVESAYLNIQASLLNIQTSTTNLAQARESLRLARLRFQAGVVTQTDVINKEESLTQAEGDRVNTILDYNQAIASLERYVYW